MNTTTNMLARSLVRAHRPHGSACNTQSPQASLCSLPCSWHPQAAPKPNTPAVTHVYYYFICLLDTQIKTCPSFWLFFIEFCCHLAGSCQLVSSSHDHKPWERVTMSFSMRKVSTARGKNELLAAQIHNRRANDRAVIENPLGEHSS